MVGLDLNKKLWCILQCGMVKGVCVGIVQYFDVLVKLVCLIIVLVMIFGFFFFVLVVYIILIFVLDLILDSEFYGYKVLSNGDLLVVVDVELVFGEQCLCEMEWYVIFDIFMLCSCFCQL